MQSTLFGERDVLAPMVIQLLVHNIVLHVQCGLHITFLPCSCVYCLKTFSIVPVCCSTWKCIGAVMAIPGCIRGTLWNTFQLFSGGHIHTGFTDVAGCVVVSPGELGVVLISVSVFTIYLSSHRCVKFIRPFIWITMVVGNCGYHGNISGFNSCFLSHDMI